MISSIIKKYFLYCIKNNTLYSKGDMIYSNTSESLKIKHLQRYQEMKKTNQEMRGKETEGQTLKKERGKGLA